MWSDHHCKSCRCHCHCDNDNAMVTGESNEDDNIDADDDEMVARVVRSVSLACQYAADS